MPAGTTVVKADRNCVPVEGKPGEYRCLSGGLTVGGSATWTLDLKIGAAGAGRITARTEIAGSDEFGPDRNAANNAAELLINPPAGAEEPDGDENSGGEGGGDDDGGLPITGANATVAAVVGIALLVAGAAAVVVTRRRRNRYVA